MPRYVDSPGLRSPSRSLRKPLRTYGTSSMGGPTIPPPPAPALLLPPSLIDATVTDNGERVVPEDNSFCFHAHLSIYNFARHFARGKRVLDAGCGTGYGSFHLLSECGAKSVLGIDVSEKAVTYCRVRYMAEGLRYRSLDLQRIDLRGEPPFDLVISSNVLEHVADVDSFFARVTSCMAPDGVFVLGVPAITSPEALAGNVENIYHINNNTPPGWLAKMRRFFVEARGYRHWVEPEWVWPDGSVNRDDSIAMENFTFTERDDEIMMSEQRTITTIIVARDPRLEPLPRNPAEGAYPEDWGVDETGLPRRPETGIVGPINEEREVAQAFICDVDRLHAIEVKLATYARINRSDLLMSLYRESLNGPIVARDRFTYEDIRDFEYTRFSFDHLTNTRGDRFVLVLHAPAVMTENAFTAPYVSTRGPGMKELTVAGREWRGNWLEMNLFGAG